MVEGYVVAHPCKLNGKTCETGAPVAKGDVAGNRAKALLRRGTLCPVKKLPAGEGRTEAAPYLVEMTKNGKPFTTALSNRDLNETLALLQATLEQLAEALPGVHALPVLDTALALDQRKGARDLYQARKEELEA